MHKKLEYAYQYYFVFGSNPDKTYFAPARLMYDLDEMAKMILRYEHVWKNPGLDNIMIFNANSFMHTPALEYVDTAFENYSLNAWNLVNAVVFTKEELLKYKCNSKKFAEDIEQRLAEKADTMNNIFCKE